MHAFHVTSAAKNIAPDHVKEPVGAEVLKWLIGLFWLIFPCCWLLCIFPFLGNTTAFHHGESFPHIQLQITLYSAAVVAACLNATLTGELVFSLSSFGLWIPTGKSPSGTQLGNNKSSREPFSIHTECAQYLSSPAGAACWQHDVVWGTKQHHRNSGQFVGPLTSCLCMCFLACMIV